MDKSKICTKTINLAKKTACAKKQNLLVYEKTQPCEPKAAPRRHVTFPTPVTCTSAKKIRVCTGAEMKKMCAPKLCDCPVSGKKKRTGFLGSLFRLLGFGFKAAVAGGLVYWTYDIGLWGPPENTEDMYKSACLVVAPKLCSQKDESEVDDEQGPATEVCDVGSDIGCIQTVPASKLQCGDIPRISGSPSVLKNAWNKGVIYLFDFLANAPQRISYALGWIQESASDIKDSLDPELKEKKRRKRLNCDDEDEKKADSRHKM